MYVTSGFSLKHGTLCRYRANHLHIRRVVSSNIALTKSERKLFSNHIFYPISGLISTFQSKKPDLLGKKKQDFSMVSQDIPDCLERSEMLSGLNIYYLEVSEMIFIIIIVVFQSLIGYFELQQCPIKSLQKPLWNEDLSLCPKPVFQFGVRTRFLCQSCWSRFQK